MMTNPSQVTDNMVWSKDLVKEFCNIFSKYIIAESDQTPKLDSDAFIAELSEIFTTYSNDEANETLMKQCVLSSSCLDTLSNSINKGSSQELIKIFNPYLKSAINFSKFNLTPSLPLELGSYLEQVKNYIHYRGIDLNIMIVGRAGSGKTTLLDTIFKCVVSRRNHECSHGDSSDIYPSSCDIKVIRHVIEESPFRIRLSIYDCPGFGDLIDNTNCAFPIINKIKNLFATRLISEKATVRNPLQLDDLIHCCVYVIPPTGHRLSELDIRCLKSLVEIVNVLPVIGRSDSLIPDELERFRLRIKDDFAKNDIKCYPYNRYNLGSDRSTDAEYSVLEEKIPLKVIGANSFESSSKKVIRKTGHGEIDLLNPTMCDLSILIDILIKKHMLNLIHTTEKIFYEKYRQNIFTNS